MKARVTIRNPKRSDAAAILSASRRSQSLHRGWLNPLVTRRAFLAHLKRIESDSHRGFLVIQKATGNLVGVININNIILGSFRSAFLGYYAFEGMTGQGLMREAMRLVLHYAFCKLKLHRLEANIQPGNKASIALVKRCGFVREGYSRRYLKICGRWRDHERWAILAEDFNSKRPKTL